MSLVYNFWTKKQVAQGQKAKLVQWSELQGTRLRWLVAFFLKCLGRAKSGRHTEVQVLKCLFYKINNVDMPSRNPGNSSNSTYAESQAGSGFHAHKFNVVLTIS